MESERVREHSTSTSQGTTILLLVLVIVLFSLVVGYGWVRLLATALDAPAAYFLATLITAIALFLARMIGKAIVTGRSDPSYGVKLFFLYPILFIISALGTINAAFYNFEGSSVLQQVIDDAEQKFAALDSRAQTALRDSGPGAQSAAEVQRLLIQLRSEIMNRRNCGVGPVARGIIGQIRTILPAFRELSRGSGGQPCNESELRQLADTYENNALGMLDIDPERRDRLALRNEISGQVADARRRMLAAESALATGGGFGNGYAQAQLALENASTAYSEAREKLVAARPEVGEELDPSIDVARARYLGSITAMPGTLAARVDYWTTWVYIIIAILLDFFLIFLFVEALRTTAPAAIVASLPQLNDPQFLWVNQGG